MTINEALSIAISKIDNRQNRLETEILLAHTLKKSREYLLINSEKKLSTKQSKDFFLLVKQRVKGMPIAYLTNHKEFYGLNFFVNDNVLIPRSETELMVDEALEYLKNSSEDTTVIDVGTGSGCIIITLAKLLNQESRIKNYCLFGLDISAQALVVAKKNARQIKVEKKIKLIKSNLLSHFLDSKFLIHNYNLLILANLPYLTPTQVKNSPSIKHEPKLALVSGTDGLKHYRELFKQINKYKITNYTLLCEIDHTQTANIKKLIKTELPKTKFVIKKDLGGYDRLVIIN